MRPQPYRWPRGHKGAVVVSIDIDGPTAGLWASRARHEPRVADLEQRRFGPRQGIWRLLDMLSRLELEASCYIPGAIAAAHPDIVEAVMAGGHEVALHGYLHERVDELPDDQLLGVLERSAAALESAGAGGPFGYRSPSWEMTEAAFAALEEFGVRYDSSLMGYDRPYLIGGLVEVPVHWSLDDAVFYRYVVGSMWPPVSPHLVMESWSGEIEACVNHNSLVMITVHPWMSGRAGRLDALEAMLRRHRADEAIWWTTSSAVAAHHLCLPDSGPVEMLRPGEI